MARMVGIPALRRAPGPRVPPSPGSGSLASRSSQAWYSNKNAGKEQSSGEIMQELARYNASFQATIDAIEESKRRQKKEWRIYMAFAAVGLGLGVYTVVAVAREARAMFRERAFDRKMREIYAAHGADMDEADMEKDTRE